MNILKLSLQLTVWICAIGALSRYLGENLWISVGIIFGLWAAFTSIRALACAVAWRIEGRKIATDRFLTMLQHSEFPKAKRNSDDDIENYLARLEDNPDVSASTRNAAKNLSLVLDSYDDFGYYSWFRMREAANAALDRYTPTISGTKATRVASLER